MNCTLLYFLIDMCLGICKVWGGGCLIRTITTFLNRAIGNESYCFVLGRILFYIDLLMSFLKKIQKKKTNECEELLSMYDFPFKQGVRSFKGNQSYVLTNPIGQRWRTFF